MVFDPLVEERVAPNVAVVRADNGDPMIVPRGETEAVPYTRASSLADFLVRNIYHLKMWEERYLIHWLAKSPDLCSWAAQVPYSTGPFTGTQPISVRQANAKQLDEIREMVLERGRIHEAANAGSAVHAATEPGAEVGPMHPLLSGAVEGYHLLTAGLERVASEVFVVCDELRAAGTFDSGYIDPDIDTHVIIGDTKTGKSIHQGEFEIQLATYAHGEIYLGPPVDGVDQRLTFEEFFGLPASHDVGYLVHVALEGKPKPRIVEMDLRRGWANAVMAATIRDARANFDKIGIGNKVDHKGKAISALDKALQALCDWHDQAVSDAQAFGMGAAADADQRFHADAQDLYQRFKPYWQESHTLVVKGRLA